MITTKYDRNLRAACQRRGLILRKVRAPKYYCPDINNGYQIISAYNGCIVAGENFELTLDNVRDWLNEYDAKQ